MEEAGLEFRATKDLAIALHVETLTPAFGKVFWAFVEAGGYMVRQSGDSGKAALYRFQKPADTRFPVMGELFSRTPDVLRPIETGRPLPIPFDERGSPTTCGGSCMPQPLSLQLTPPHWVWAAPASP